MVIGTRRSPRTDAKLALLSRRFERVPECCGLGAPGVDWRHRCRTQPARPSTQTQSGAHSLRDWSNHGRVTRRAELSFKRSAWKTSMR